MSEINNSLSVYWIQQKKKKHQLIESTATKMITIDAQEEKCAPPEQKTKTKKTEHNDL